MTSVVPAILVYMIQTKSYQFRNTVFLIRVDILHIKKYTIYMIH